MKDKIIIFDTETTGLTKSDMIVELGAIGIDGEVFIDTLIIPLKPIPWHATKVHGITTKQANKDGVIWDHVWAYLKTLIEDDYTFYAYNSKFDLRMIRQTNLLHGIEDFDAEDILEENLKCAMLEYQKYAELKRYTKLSVALEEENIEWKEDIPQHRAIGDCWATKELLNKMWS